MQSRVGSGEDLGFYPKGSESHGGLWAERGQNLTWVVTGTGRTDCGGKSRRGAGGGVTMVEVTALAQMSSDGAGPGW